MNQVDQMNDKNVNHENVREPEFTAEKSPVSEKHDREDNFHKAFDRFHGCIPADIDFGI